MDFLNRQDPTNPRIMLFDLSINGHHPAYIKHLIIFWGKSILPFSLDIVVLPKFLQCHADIVDLARQYDHDSIRFISISENEQEELQSRRSGVHRIKRSFQEWSLLCSYASYLKSDHCLILYFDTFQIPLIFSRSAPCPLSGIYFRPTFHYQDFAQDYSSLYDHIQRLKEKILLRKVLHNPRLKTLFSLDPFAVKYLQTLQKKVQILALPDPIEQTFVSSAQVQQLRDKLGIEEHRKVALLFGALTERKGIYETLSSLISLPNHIHKNLCLVLAGQANSKEQQRLMTKVEEINSVCSVQIISQLEFIAESEVPVYFQMADIVLAPYQRHVGMSGILLQAAAAGKPVLSSNFGLMGEMVRRYHLGLAIDSSKISEITMALSQLLVESNVQYFDSAKMKDFAEKNSADRFADVIFKAIYN